jgi:hypothetical protein
MNKIRARHDSRVGHFDPEVGHNETQLGVEGEA